MGKGNHNKNKSNNKNNFNNKNGNNQNQGQSNNQNKPNIQQNKNYNSNNKNNVNYNKNGKKKPNNQNNKQQNKNGNLNPNNLKNNANRPNNMPKNNHPKNGNPNKINKVNGQNKPSQENNNENKQLVKTKDKSMLNVNVNKNLVKVKKPNNQNKLENKNISNANTKKEDVKVEKSNVVNVENENNKSNEKKSKGKFGKVICIISLILLIAVIGLGIYFGINYKSDKICRNLYIEGLNVTGKTCDEAREELNKEYEKIIGKDLMFSYEGKEYSLNLDNIDFSLKIDEAVDKAYKIGKNDNIFIAIKDFYLYTFVKEENIRIDFSYDKEKLSNNITEIEKNFYKEVVQYSYRIEGDNLIVTNGTEGISVNYEDFEEKLKLAIENKNVTQILQMPIIVVKPDPIDVEKIHQEVYVEMSNASYTTDPFEIHQEVQGIDFDKTVLASQVNEDPYKTEYAVQVVRTDPTVRVENLDLYNDVLGQCTTAYVNNPNRTTNLRLAAGKINGLVLMPGESFSYNDVVGERTYAAGYRNAAIYVNGEVEDGLAGGICQISSTLYDAVVFANLEVTERYNHARVPSYLGAGKDATVYWGSKDFKFKNNRSFPIKINISVQGGYATATISGKKTDQEYDISLVSSVVSRYGGYMVVNTYKVYKQKGAEVKREFLYTDSYKI